MGEKSQKLKKATKEQDALHENMIKASEEHDLDRALEKLRIKADIIANAYNLKVLNSDAAIVELLLALKEVYTVK